MLSLLKVFSKITSQSDKDDLYNQLVGNLDSNFRTIEKQINTVQLGQMILYTTSTRPDPSRVPVGSFFFNTTTNLPNFSDGINWRNAAGTIV